MNESFLYLLKREVAKTVAKFHCFKCFEEVLVLKWNNFKMLTASGNLELTFFKAKNNQFHEAKKTIIAKNASDLTYCPVNIVSKYFLELVKPKADSYFLPKIVKNVPLFLEQASYEYCVKRFKLCF